MLTIFAKLLSAFRQFLGVVFGALLLGLISLTSFVRWCHAVAKALFPSQAPDADPLPTAKRRSISRTAQP